MHAPTHPHPTSLGTATASHCTTRLHPPTRPCDTTQTSKQTLRLKGSGSSIPGGGWWAGRQGPEPAANPPRPQRALRVPQELPHLPQKYPCRYFHTSSTHIGPRGKQSPHVLLCPLFPTLPMPIWFSPRIMQSEKRRSPREKECGNAPFLQKHSSQQNMNADPSPNRYRDCQCIPKGERKRRFVCLDQKKLLFRSLSSTFFFLGYKKVYAALPGFSWVSMCCKCNCQ